MVDFTESAITYDLENDVSNMEETHAAPSVPKLRTAKQIVDEYPDIGVTLWYLKTLAKSGNIKTVKCGNKTLINVAYLFRYLNGET